MVVDDERIVWEVIRAALEGPHVFLDYATDGEKAISMIISEKYDLVITDKNLPGITGLDVVRQLKRRDPSVSALMITAYASRESAEEAMAIGCDDYLVKPFDVDTLRQKVADLLERRDRRLEMAGKPSTVGANRRIMVAEKDDATWRVIADALAGMGHQVRRAKSTTDVLEAVRNGQADGLVCSLEMLDSDSASSCFLRSALVVHPEVILVAIAEMQDLKNAVDAASYGCRKIMYRNLMKDAKTVAEQLAGVFG